jgi:polyisoprenyl-phosphate glycosyltransferase
LKTISIVLPCYNEQENVGEMYRLLVAEFQNLARFNYELIFIDNCSTDETPQRLKKIAASDPGVKLIFNSRNFGHIRSPYHGLLQASGDAVMLMASDLQDPPALLPRFVALWEQGFKVVVAVKNKSEENGLMFRCRKLYYLVLDRVSDFRQIRNYTGFGLYDRQVISELRKLKEPYPFFRGLIAEIGFERATVEFLQPVRKKGLTKNNFFSLYDIGILGLVSYSKVPLRFATFMGVAAGFASLLIALGYLIYKLIFWNSFQVGIAPLVIGLFLISSIQLFFLGIIGEYIGVVFTQTKDRPLVVEKERVNF